LTASVASFLTKAQKRGTELPAPLSGALLLAAIRLSEAKSQGVRPYQLLVDDDGNLDLLSGEPPSGDAYAAPELRNGAVLSDDAKVLVYAAGALGYELATLTAPPSGEAVGEELQGPFAKIIRRAMADRQKRFRNLGEMARAVEAIHARPSKEEERLILSAVAASTPLPPAQKLAKLELERAVSPEPAPRPAEDPPPAKPPVFTEISDSLDLQPPPAEVAPPPQPTAGGSDAEPLRAELEAEKKARTELATAVQARTQEVRLLEMRLSLLEEQVRNSAPPPPPLSAVATLLRDVNLLIEQRRFTDAERLLRDPLVQDNALLQFRLGQALSSPGNASAPALGRAQAAFEKAGALDPSWAQPRVELGRLSLRLGRRQEADGHWKEALRLDPGCPEALAAAAPQVPARRGGAAGFALSAVGGAIAAALVVFVLRPATLSALAPTQPAAASPIPVPAPVQAQASALTSAPEAAPNPTRTTAPPPPVPAAQPAKLSLPELKLAAEPAPPATRAPRAESKPRSKKVASAGRAAAEAEAAKGDRALRAFDTKSAEAAFSAALKLDPTFPAAHRGMGMVYVLLGKNAEAKAAYNRYLQLAPEAPDRDQIARLVSR